MKLDQPAAMRNVNAAACLAEYANRGSRYTNYPPIAAFGPVSSEDVDRELSTIGERQEPVSLYVRAAFCKHLREDCGCNVIATRDEDRGFGYVDQLATEMAVLGRSVRGAPVTEIVIAGGSASCLSPHAMRTLFAALESYFAIASDARRSIELDPRTTTSAHVGVLAAARFRSLRMEVRDFSEVVQDTIHCHQTTLQVRGLVDRARVAGVDEINVDVAYGLPLETETSFAATLDAVIDLAPDRIVLFDDAQLPRSRSHQHVVDGAGRVLDRYERAALLLLGIEKLTDAGYDHLGLDHFAKPGSRFARAVAEHRIVRTLQGYVEHKADTILGLGVSAISSSPRMCWQNHGELPAWGRDLERQAPPVERGIVLGDDDRVRRAVIGQLMCDGEVDLDRIGREHGIHAPSYFMSELAALSSLGKLAVYDGGTRMIRTTPLGRLLARNVCKVFDRYHHEALAAAPSPTMPDAQPRYSLAI